MLDENFDDSQLPHFGEGIYDPLDPENAAYMENGHILSVSHWEKKVVEEWFLWFIGMWGLENLRASPLRFAR